MDFSVITIHTIDLEQTKILKRTIPQGFSEFSSELFDHIDNNKTTRNYKTRSLNTEVISAATEVSKNQSKEMFHEKSEIIASRLLREELNAQDSIKNMNGVVRKGSCIQAFAQSSNGFIYLLAKVQHRSYIDDIELISRTGFPQDQKGIWKSCLIFFDSNCNINTIKIYSDNGAKYWNNTFLELDPINSDDDNTANSFSAIDNSLNILKSHPRDKLIFRNNIITYIKTHDTINYDEMISDCVSRIDNTSVEKATIEKLERKLRDLPDKKNFDRQFTSAPKAITAKVRKVYTVSQGIKLHIDIADGSPCDKIVSIQDPTGEKFLKLAVEDETTYQAFLKRD